MKCDAGPATKKGATKRRKRMTNMAMKYIVDSDIQCRAVWHRFAPGGIPGPCFCRPTFKGQRRGILLATQQVAARRPLHGKVRLTLGHRRFDDNTGKRESAGRNVGYKQAA